MQQEGRVLKFPALSNFCAGHHFGMVTVMGSFSSFVFCVFVMAPVSSVMSNADYWSVIPAERICKPGPPLTVTTGKMNCLIIGDSISIGYALLCLLLAPRHKYAFNWGAPFCSSREFLYFARIPGSMNIAHIRF